MFSFTFLLISPSLYFLSISDLFDLSVQMEYPITPCNIKFIWSIIKIQNKTIYCCHSVVGYIHTGLCSKGTSISNPGSQLPPEDPLVSPFISPFTALTLMETC